MKRVLMIVALAVSAITLSAQDHKFGHVNFSEIVQLMPDTDSARVKLETAQKDANETYQSMVTEYQTKYEQYQQKQASWTPAVKESKGRELMEIEQRITDFQNSIQQELAMMQQTLMVPITEKVVSAVKTISSKLGLTYVFDTTSLLYFDASKSRDLTAELKAELGIPADKVLQQPSQQQAL